MNFKFVSAILRGKWAIDPLFAINAAPVLADILNGKTALAESDNDDSDFSVDEGKKVAIITISGSLMKDDGPCGEPGMATIGQFIQAADNDKDIDAIVLSIDSPGGTVDGTMQLSDIVKSASKPVVTYVNGMMASAALWIGSSADEIFASSPFDEIGSVGVLLSFADVQPAYEKQGVKFHNVVSSLSPDKIKWFEEIRAGKYQDYIKENLDPIAAEFQETIKRNRHDVRDEHLTGKVFFAKDVMGVFVDQIGTIDDAIARASELAKRNQPNINVKMNYERLTKAIGEDSLEFEADGRRTFTTEEMQAIETALAVQQPEPAEDHSEELQAEISSRSEEIEKLKAEIADRDAQIENLLAAPAAQPRQIVKDSDHGTSRDSDYLSKDDVELYMKIKR